MSAWRVGAGVIVTMLGLAGPLIAQSDLRVAVHGGLYTPVSGTDFDAGITFGTGLVYAPATRWALRVGADYARTNGVDRIGAMLDAEYRFTGATFVPFVTAGAGLLFHNVAILLCDCPVAVGIPPQSAPPGATGGRRIPVARKEWDVGPAGRVGGGATLREAERFVPFFEVSALVFGFGDELFQRQFDIAWRFGVRVGFGRARQR